MKDYYFILTFISVGAAVACLLFFKIKTNIILMYILIEILIFYTNVNYMGVSILLDDITGIIFSIFIAAASGIELGVGLSLVIILFSGRNTISLDDISNVKA